MVEGIPEAKLNSPMCFMYPIFFIVWMQTLHYKCVSISLEPELRRYPTKFARAIVSQISKMRCSTNNRFAMEVSCSNWIYWNGFTGLKKKQQLDQLARARTWYNMFAWDWFFHRMDQAWQQMLPAAQVDTTSPLLHCVWGVPCSSWSEADLYPVVRYARGMHGLAVPSDMTQVDFYLREGVI